MKAKKKADHTINFDHALVRRFVCVFYRTFSLNGRCMCKGSFLMVFLTKLLYISDHRFLLCFRIRTYVVLIFAVYEGFFAQEMFFFVFVYLSSHVLRVYRCNPQRTQLHPVY